MRKIKLNEYEITEDLENGIFKVLRNGEEWRNLIGDNFVLALIDRIEELYDDVEFLDCLRACGVDNWNGYSEAYKMLNSND